MIRNVLKSDAPSICNIYNFYVKTSVITFEEEPVTVGEMEKRIIEVTLNFPWIVYEDHKKVTGYAYASRWKQRSSYRYSAECGVYVEKDNFRKGIGSKLIKSLIVEMESRKFHSLLGGIALPNDASITLIEKLGFKKCGVLKEVGYKFGKWIDVGYWQKII